VGTALVIEFDGGTIAETVPDGLSNSLTGILALWAAGAGLSVTGVQLPSGVIVGRHDSYASFGGTLPFAGGFTGDPSSPGQQGALLQVNSAYTVTVTWPGAVPTQIAQVVGYATNGLRLPPPSVSFPDGHTIALAIRTGATALLARDVRDAILAVLAVWLNVNTGTATIAFSGASSMSDTVDLATGATGATAAQGPNPWWMQGIEGSFLAALKMAR
jgi:hypothetical protein